MGHANFHVELCIAGSCAPLHVFWHMHPVHVVYKSVYFQTSPNALLLFQFNFQFYVSACCSWWTVCIWLQKNGSAFLYVCFRSFAFLRARGFSLSCFCLVLQLCVPACMHFILVWRFCVCMMLFRFQFDLYDFASVSRCLRFDTCMIFGASRVLQLCVTFLFF